MTIEEQTNASSTAETVQEQATATEVSTEAQPNVAGNKRAFDEIQARAVVTIHDLADEDDENDSDYKESDVEDEDAEVQAVEVAESSVQEEAQEEDDEEEADEEEEEEQEEDISVEELTGVIEESGLGEVNKEDLSVKVLRGGKKIAREVLEAQLQAAAASEEAAKEETVDA